MKCDICLNKSICKYIKDMARMEIEVKNINFITEGSPVLAEAKCDMHRSNVTD